MRSGFDGGRPRVARQAHSTAKSGDMVRIRRAKASLRGDGGRINAGTNDGVEECDDGESPETELTDLNVFLGEEEHDEEHQEANAIAAGEVGHKRRSFHGLNDGRNSQALVLHIDPQFAMRPANDGASSKGPVGASSPDAVPAGPSVLHPS